MKKIYCFLIFLLLGSNLYAQNRVFSNGFNHSIKAGVTSILFGSGDLRGINYYNEYNHKLSPHFTLAPAIQVGFGSATRLIESPGFTDELRFTKGSVALDLNLYASPMRFERSKVRLGIGPSLRYLSDSNPNLYSIYYPAALPNFPPDFDYIVGPFRYSKPQNYFTLGYSVVAEGELNVFERCQLGVRAAFQNYQSGETALTLGLNFGYQF